MAGDLISQNMGSDPNAPRKAQWTSPNGLTTTGVMNPLGLSQNNASIGYFGATPPPGSPGYVAPTQTPVPTPTTPPPAQPTPVSPLAPGQTDPTGDARRLAAYQAAGYTQNQQGGWDAPAPSPSEPQPMATGDPRRNQPMIPDANSPVQPAVEQPPPMASADLITGLRRPGMSNRGGLNRRLPGY